jgi:hypothetical protein
VTCTRQVLHDIALGKGDKEDGKDKSDKGKKKVILKERFLTHSFPLHLTGSQFHALTRVMTRRTARVTMGMARSVMMGMARRVTTRTNPTRVRKRLF